jgi:hypothetical protein
MLGPLYAWVSALPPGLGTRLPDGLVLILIWLKREVEDRALVPLRPKLILLPELFRADAKAEGLKVVLGGWEVHPGSEVKPCPLSRWYSLTLTKDTAPWAFSKNDEPFRTIAALELLASTLCLIAFGDRIPLRSGEIQVVVGSTDNQGNEGLVRREATTKYPLSLIHMEMASQLKARGAELDLRWIEREKNVPADMLTNDDFSLFREEMRVMINLSKVKFMVMPWLAKESLLLESEMANLRKRKAEDRSSQPPARKVLARSNDPW